MSLAPGEQSIWELCVRDLTQEPALDEIEQAANDFRVTTALSHVIKGTEISFQYDFEELCMQIAGDYELSPEEVLEAFDIAEGRIAHEQT